MNGLEALNKIQHDFGQLKGQELVSCYETIFNALQRLEAIDNANPSKALECLERIEADLVGLPKHVTEYDDIFDDYLDDIEDNIDTIKQALLKAQEPKQHLKWEDLEFKEEEQTMIVKIGDNQYKIWYRQFKNGKQTVQIANYYPFRSLVNLYDKDIDKQFFNDLHLERVEE